MNPRMQPSSRQRRRRRRDLRSGGTEVGPSLQGQRGRPGGVRGHGHRHGRQCGWPPGGARRRRVHDRGRGRLDGFLRGLAARGPSGVAMVISDAREGMKNAIASVLPGACRQRCRTRAMRNLLTRFRMRPRHPHPLSEIQRFPGRLGCLPSARQPRQRRCPNPPNGRFA